MTVPREGVRLRRRRKNLTKFGAGRGPRNETTTSGPPSTKKNIARQTGERKSGTRSGGGTEARRHGKD